MLELPPAVRTKARAVGADDWVAALPGIVADLAAEWSITIGPAFPAATEAFVAEATRADGSPAVLKVMLPRPDGDVATTEREITVLRIADGRGCARLLEAKPPTAVLLERLGHPLVALGLPLGRRLEILCDAAREVWRPARDLGPSLDLPSGAEKAAWLADAVVQMWEELARPCSERAVAAALTAAERRRAAHDDAHAVLVHGDVHQWNTLQAGTGFKLVDPDGLVAEPECDLGILMREDPDELLEGDPLGRARWLAARTGLDAAAIWDWGVVERVSTGLLGTRIGLQPVAGRMLAVADELARRGISPR